MNPESQELSDRRPLRLAGSAGQPNAFRAGQGEQPPLPSFAAVRQRLPVPVLPHNPDWEVAYWAAWEAVWSGLRNTPANSPLTGPVFVNEQGSPSQMDHSAVVARLAGYVAPDFDLIHLLDNFYGAQLGDGYIPRDLDIHSGESCFPAYDPNSTGPNLLAWAEWRHFRLTGDDTRLRDVLIPIAAYHRWLRLHHTWQSGLYWTTGYASGNPNQTCVPGGGFHHAHWAWLAPTLQANISALRLGRMAERLGEAEAVEDITAERLNLMRQINEHLWNETTDFYHPVGPDGRFSEARSMVAYWALLDKQLVPEQRSKAMVQALRDEHNARRKAGEDRHSDDNSAGELPVTLAPIEYTLFSKYIALRGLQRSGAWSLAHNTAADQLNDDLRATAAQGDLPVSAALRVAMIMEQIVGLHIDWPLRQVSWHNYLGDEDEVGVRNIRLGDEGSADLIAAGGVLTVRTDAPFTLGYRDNEQDFQSAVPEGVSTFDLR